MFATLTQHQASIGSTRRVCWVEYSRVMILTIYKADIITPLMSNKCIYHFTKCQIHPFHHTISPLGYERMYLPLYKVADTPLHIQRDDITSLFTTMLCKGKRQYLLTCKISRYCGVTLLWIHLATLMASQGQVYELGGPGMPDNI